MPLASARSAGVNVGRAGSSARASAIRSRSVWMMVMLLVQIETDFRNSSTVLQIACSTACPGGLPPGHARSEEHTSELQSLMRISYAVFCLQKKNHQPTLHSKEVSLPEMN